MRLQAISARSGGGQAAVMTGSFPMSTASFPVLRFRLTFAARATLVVGSLTLAMFGCSLGTAILAALLSASPATAQGLDLPAPTECAPIPGNPREWPYELQDPPFKGSAPLAPQQITDIKRSHHAGPKTPVPAWVILPEVPDHRGSSYCLYTPPAGTTPAGSQGLILFLHGAGGFFIRSGSNDPMLQYLASHGFYVVLPDAANLFLDMGFYPQRAGAALRDAVEHLRSRRVQIDKIAVVGHSLGGATAVRLMADWDHLTAPPPQKPPPAGQPPKQTKPPPPLPKPSALVLLEGGGADDKVLAMLKGLGRNTESWDVTPRALESIQCATRLLIIEAEASALPPKPGQQSFWTNLKQIAKFTGAPGTTPPVLQRNFLRVRHDVSHAHMGIVLPSTHAAPTAAPRQLCGVFNGGKDDYGCYLTAMKFHGYWRPTLAAVHEAFTGKPLADNYSPYCSSRDTSGTCAGTRFAGTWADGIAATPLLTAAEVPGDGAERSAQRCTPAGRSRWTRQLQGPELTHWYRP